MARSTALICLIGLLMTLFASDEPGVELLADRLSVDVLVPDTAHYYRFTAGGLKCGEKVLERMVALAGLTCRISPVVSVRAYFDIGNHLGIPARDVYTDLAWPSGWVRVGQFLLPLGCHDRISILENDEQLIPCCLHQVGRGRDIGVMGSLPSDMPDSHGTVAARRRSVHFDCRLVSGGKLCLVSAFRYFES